MLLFFSWVMDACLFDGCTDGGALLHYSAASLV